MESRSTTIEEEILKIISELVMAGRTSRIKTTANIFPELRIMQINTCWKDNSKYFPMCIWPYSLGWNIQAVATKLSRQSFFVYFQIEPF
jgi:hypothetical protein